MQLRQALGAAIAQLEAAGIDAARLQAEVLACHVLDCGRAYLFAHPERELNADEQAQYEQLVARLAAHEPLQYLTGHQEFWKADFIVTPAVLIPRPETEHLIEAVLELAHTAPSPYLPKEGKYGPPEGKYGPPDEAAPFPHLPTEGRYGAPHVSPNKLREGQCKTGAGLRILDVGTGSGAIAITLARELPEAELFAVDLSAAALEVARRNAARLLCKGWERRVRFLEGDLLDALGRDVRFGEIRFDFVVSNPPYIGEAEAAEVQESVRRHEPPMALFAGADGLEVIRRLIPQAREALRPGGWLLMEIGYRQAEAVRALLGQREPGQADLGQWDEVTSICDLAGISRVIIARRPE